MAYHMQKIYPRIMLFYLLSHIKSRFLNSTRGDVLRALLWSRNLQRTSLISLALKVSPYPLPPLIYSTGVAEFTIIAKCSMRK
jgi:hypothetical protein